MQTSDLRIALFSGNYNYLRDGANQALNRLVEYLLRQGAKVRVYAPTTPTPAFEPQGDLVSLPSMPFPGRTEFRFPLGVPKRILDDIEAFNPKILHVSSPDYSAHRAVSWARSKNVPILASVHTRFETYPRYYGLGFTEPLVEAMLRRFYHRCDGLVAPTESQITTLREQGMHHDISIWSRGVDRKIFASDKRDNSWRRSKGIADDDIAIVFLGRLVMEKGLDAFAETIVQLRRRQLPHKVLIIGEGPAQQWFEQNVPDGIFVGFQSGADLGRALASGDLFFNPSITETFGNVTLEAMACGLPVVASAATGSQSLVQNSVSGTLVPPGDAGNFADAIAPYLTDESLRRSHGEAGEKRSLGFSWDAINQAVAETYIRLIEARQK
ncbi:MAG: glycosyltransferase family 1 protein [Pontixanthobacter sp.]